MACLAAKPIVNGIEKDLEEIAPVIRINLMSRFGREAAGRFRVDSVPTLIVLDGEGKIIYRHSGIPSRQEVVATLSPP